MTDRIPTDDHQNHFRTTEGNQNHTGSNFRWILLIAVLAAAAVIVGILIWKGSNSAQSGSEYRKTIDVSKRPSDEFTAALKKNCTIDDSGITEIANSEMLKITNTSKTEKLDFDVHFQFLDRDGNNIVPEKFIQDHVKISGVPPGMTVIANGYVDGIPYECNYTVKAYKSIAKYSLGDVSIEWSDDFSQAFVSYSGAEKIGTSINLIAVYETDEWISEDCEYFMQYIDDKPQTLPLSHIHRDMQPVLYFLCSEEE